MEFVGYICPAPTKYVGANNIPTSSFRLASVICRLSLNNAGRLAETAGTYFNHAFSVHCALAIHRHADETKELLISTTRRTLVVWYE